MVCEKCGKEIPSGRLAVLPNTTTCVKCSKVRPIIAVATWQGKSFTGLVMVDTADKNNMRYATAQLYQKCAGQIFAAHSSLVDFKDRFEDE